MKRIVGILLACIFVLSGCTDKKQEVFKEQESNKEMTRHVLVKEIRVSEYLEELSLSGNIIPVQTVKTAFKIPGVISEVLVNEGDRVEKGQVIAKLKQQDYEIKVKATSAELAAAELQIETEIPTKINQAKAQYDLTKASYERAQALFEQEAVSKAQLDEISAKLIVDENTYQQAQDAKGIAETKLQMAEASLEAARTTIDDTVIYSPISGVVLQKTMQEGEVTAAGYPVAVIGQLDEVWVQIGVSDEYINSLYKGQAAEVYVYGTQEIQKAVIDEIGSLADAKTRTFPVKLLVDNKEGKLKLGMVTKVRLPINQSQKVAIPLGSVMQLSDGPAVYVYSDKTQTVSKKRIETGEILKDQIEVLDGLESGDKLVVEGQFVIKDGDKVAAEEMKE
jgi:RND family efflux transporter MFP subunit